MVQEEVGAMVREALGGISISEAARRLGMARPGLSNLVAGKARLTRETALRLADEFPADVEALLRGQGAVDAVDAARRVSEASARSRDAEWRRQAADFHDITVTDIDRWAQTGRARSVLPALVRRLVHAVAPDAGLVDFPSHDAGQRPGWDGRVDAKRDVPWVPAGLSGWELSVSADLPGKPNADLAQRTKLPAAERRETTFVFATARRWDGKDDWAERQRRAGGWKDVRAFDASDLAQWLDLSAPTQAWFAAELGRSIEGVRPMDEVWRAWAGAANPVLAPSLFAPAVEAYRARLFDWLANPAERPFVVVADSVGEAVAFLAVALREPDGAEGVAFGQASAVSTRDAMRRMAAAAPNAILVAESAEAELAASGLYATHRIIVARPRSVIEQDPDVSLEPLGDEAFDKALDDMGLARDEWQRWQAEAGNSPTILRRRLAVSPELRRPAWSQQPVLLRKLMPIFLAGAWNRQTAGDVSFVELLAGKGQQELERDVAELAALEDAPVWSIGSYRGVVSRKDALFAIADAITPDDFFSFLTLAELILSLDDPRLDLPAEDRWRAGMLEKRPEVSGALREAVGELLVLFAIHGDSRLRGRVPDAGARIDALVARILTGSNTRAWLSRQADLRLLAEASPEAFLRAVEADLRSADPQLLALLRPVGSAPFDGPDRTNLLWALESVAWRRDDFPRVFDILARLSEVAIDDNWSNKPENSLASLVRFWLPQTAAPIEDRLAKVTSFAATRSAVAWRLLTAQVSGHQMASPNAHPKWRNDAAGRDAGPTRADAFAMRRRALDLLLAWPGYTADQLGQLFEMFEELPEEDRDTLFRRAEEWSVDAPDADRADLAERLRRFVVRHQMRTRGRSKPDRVAALSARLVPQDPIIRHGWLFADHWVPEAAGEMDADDFDFDARSRRIADQRREAVREVRDAFGLDGVLQLMRNGRAHGAIGDALRQVVAPAEHAALIDEFLDRDDPEAGPAIGSVLLNLVHGLNPEARRELLVNGARDDAQALRLFLAAPFDRSTWDVLEAARASIAADYWASVPLQPWNLTAADMSFMIDRSLGAARPLATFQGVGMSVKALDPADLARVLRAVMQADPEEAATVRVDPYRLGEALAAVSAADAMPLAERAQVEFLFLDGLDHGQHGVPSLDRLISESPGEFVNLVTIAFKRDDGTVEEQPDAPAPEHRREVVSRVWRLLERLGRVPGTRGDGSIDATALLKWIVAVRDGCRAAGRLASGDRRIGNLLAKSPVGPDGHWPHPSVRDALDAIGTEEVDSGFHIGKFNCRGVVMRGPGGGQERAIAKVFRDDAAAMRLEHPFTARCLIGLADDYDRQGQWEDTDEAVRKRLGRS